MLSSEEIFKRLESLINAEKPFSLLRFGDAEGLQCFRLPVDVIALNKSYVKQFGEIPKPENQDVIAENIRSSFIDCDIAGLPFGFKSEVWNYTLRRFSEMDPEKTVCSANIHIYLNADPIFRKIIAYRDVFYISPRNVDEQLFTMGAKSVESIHNSGQYKFECEKPEVPFYRQVREIEDKISKMDLTSKLCLFGTGAAGKHLGNMMRDNGGMVIDIGSVFDLWAGIETRSWIKERKDLK